MECGVESMGDNNVEFMLMCVRACVLAIYGEIVVGRSIPNAMLGL